MKQHLCFYLGIAVVAVAGCTSLQTPQAIQSSAAQPKVVTLDNTVKIIAGQTVYVPIYSHIYTVERERTWNLTATLSVRNTDINYPIIVTSTNYYGSDGVLIRKHLEQPIELKPLASTDFVVDQDDITGGVGAAFIVEWVAQSQVSSPVVEAVMINTVGNQGLSFVSNGRVIKSQPGSQLSSQ